MSDIEDPRPYSKEPHDHELHSRDRQNIYGSLTNPVDKREWCAIFAGLETRQAETSGQGFSQETEDQVDDAHAYPAVNQRSDIEVFSILPAVVSTRMFRK